MNCILLTYLLTSWCRILFERLIVTQLIKTYPAFFMEPKSLLLCSQKPAIGPYSEPLNPVFPIDLYLPMVHLNVILSPTPWSSQWSLTFGPSNQNPINTSPIPHACHMSGLPHPPWFNHPNNIRWRIQAVKFIIMQFSPWSIFLNTLFSKTLSLCSSLKVRGQVSHPYSTTGKITVLYILIFSFFDIRREDNLWKQIMNRILMIYRMFYFACFLVFYELYHYEKFNTMRGGDQKWRVKLNHINNNNNRYFY
jgi:hypothetical protein